MRADGDHVETREFDQAESDDSRGPSLFELKPKLLKGGYMGEYRGLL